MTGTLQQTLTLGGSAAAFLVLGIVFLYIGLRGRRRGEGRFCRKCGYDLTGSAGVQCSECGSDLTRPRAIVIGRRIRVHSLIIAGAVLVLVGVAVGWPAYEAARKVRWYIYAPEFLLLRDLHDPSRGRTQSAYFVLRDRYQLRKLSPDATDAWIEFCVRQFESPSPNPIVSGQLDAQLTHFYTDNRLSESQRARFFTAFFTCDFAVRPRVRLGEWGAIRVNYRTRWPRHFDGDLQIDVFVDGKPWPIPLLESSGAVRTRLTMAHSEHFRDLPLGEHRIDARWRMTVRDSKSDPSAPPVFHVDRTFEGRTTVLAELPAEDTAFRHSPDLDEGMRAAVETVLLTLDASDPGRPVVHGILALRHAPPCNLAMRVLAQAPGGWVELGDTCVDRGSFGVNGGFSIGNPPPFDEPATLLFVPDAAATRNAIELGNFWDGQILFRDVPVTRSARPPVKDPTSPLAELGRVRAR